MSRLKKPVRGHWSRQLWNEYLDAREKLIDGIFAEAEEMGLSDNKLAAEANLCYQTVRNLESYTTVEPRETTIWKLARAVGFQIEYKKIVRAKPKLKIKKAG